ncbi:MAG: DUF115 domain-containing protein [bacterium]|nr:DUF115 domain-containing protein [bacterium]
MNTFEKNMQALATHHPELVAQIQQGVDTSHIAVKTAHSGARRLQVTTSADLQVLIHNENDPLASAKEAASNLPIEDGQLLILLGFGLGYLSLELFKIMGKDRELLICETDLGIFTTALRYTDLERLLLSERVKIMAGDNIPVQAWLAARSASYLSSKALLIRYDPCLLITPERYEELEKKTIEMTGALDVNANTLIALGQLFMLNQFENMPWTLRAPGVKQLTNLFTGRPGIVVNAGPSLENNFELLKEVKGKAVIIAVDTVLRLLLSHHIQPDIVVTLDPLEVNYNKFNNLEIDPQVPLVFSPASYPKIVKNYPGPKFVTAHNLSIFNRFSCFWEEKGDITMASQSVSHMSFNLARLMGLDPIVFIGLDLCFPQQKIHAADLTEGETTWDELKTRTIWCTDIFGQRVETLANFKSFQHFFEQLIELTPALCINATEGGVRLDGAEVIRFRDVIDQYCQVEPVNIIDNISTIKPMHQKHNMTGLYEQLKQISSHAKKIERKSRQIIRYVRILQKLERSGRTDHPRYARLSLEADEATTYMQGQTDVLTLLPEYAYLLELYMSKSDIKGIDDMDDQDERFTQQLERALVYYPGLLRVLVSFEQGINALIKHLEIEQRVDRELKSPPRGDLLSLAKRYKALARFDRAIPLLKQCLQDNPAAPDPFYHLADVYVDQGRYKEARTLLDNLKHAEPNFVDLPTLSSRYQNKQAGWEKRLAEARQRSKPTETTNQTESLLEAGNFYFKIQDLERAKTAYENVLAAHPNLAEAHYHLAHTFFAQEDFDSGVNELEVVLRLTPDNPVAYRDLGLVALQHEEFEPAERFLLKAIELRQDDLYPYEILADLYVQNSAWLQAAQVYEEILRLEPHRSDILQRLAVVYQSQITVAVDAD